MIEVTYFQLLPHPNVGGYAGTSRFDDLSQLIYWLNNHIANNIVTLITHIKELPR